MTKEIKDVLEKRLKSLKSLQLITAIKRKEIKHNQSFREYYTNKRVNERNENNGSELHNENYNQPLLLRQYNICVGDTGDIDLLESQNNIQTEFVKQSIDLCTFTRDEIKYLIENYNI